MKIRDIEIGRLFGQSENFRVYTGTADDETPVILKIASDFDKNSVLSAEAGRANAMQTLDQRIRDIQARYGNETAGYHLLFTKLRASFMEPTQGDRRINVFETPDTDLDHLTPLSKLAESTVIDPRTSVWVMGRLFKLYGFYELMAADEDISGPNAVPRYPVFSPDDYLIGPERHRLLYYNFTDTAPDAVATNFVKSISTFILSWLDTENLVGTAEDDEYVKWLQKRAKDGSPTAQEAHARLYALVERLWGIHYYPFTYRQRGSLTGWETWQTK